MSDDIKPMTRQERALLSARMGLLYTAPLVRTLQRLLINAADGDNAQGALELAQKQITRLETIVRKCDNTDADEPLDLDAVEEALDCHSQHGCIHWDPYPPG